MSEEIVPMEIATKWLPLVKIENKNVSWGYYVLVSHEQLDGLVGRLMQMCELTGDIEQRKALKDEIKFRSRQWLDNLYSDAGFDKWKDNLRDGYNAVNIGELIK